jgi:sugar lactone lactonase YvrE
MAILKMSAKQVDVTVSTLMDNGHRLKGIADDTVGGFWVGGYSAGTVNTPGVVYHVNTSGSSTVLLPYSANHPGSPQAPSPQVSELLLDNNILYVSDYIYGTIYRYDTRGRSPEASVLYDFPKGATLTQSGALAFMNDQLWFNELHDCWLYGFDLQQKALINQVDMVKAAKLPNIFRQKDIAPPLTLMSLAATNINNEPTLWVVVMNNAAPEESALVRIDATDVTQTTSWIIPSAQGLVFDAVRHQIYISTPAGLWTKDVTGEAPPALTIPAAFGGGYGSPYWMTLDPAGYLWVVDNNHQGMLYEIDLDHRSVVEYPLKTGSNTHSVIPAQVIWTTSGEEPDILWIVDNDNNSRVIAFTPPDSIDPQGKSALVATAVLDTGQAEPGEDFSSFVVWVKKNGAAVNVPVHLWLVSLSLEATATCKALPGLNSTDGDIVNVPEEGLPMRLTAGLVNGRVGLQAWVRGQR